VYVEQWKTLPKNSKKWVELGKRRIQKKLDCKSSLIFKIDKRRSLYWKSKHLGVTNSDVALLDCFDANVKQYSLLFWC